MSVIPAETLEWIERSTVKLDLGSVDAVLVAVEAILKVRENPELEHSVAIREAIIEISDGDVEKAVRLSQEMNGVTSLGHGDMKKFQCFMVTIPNETNPNDTMNFVELQRVVQERLGTDSCPIIGTRLSREVTRELDRHRSRMGDDMAEMFGALGPPQEVTREIDSHRSRLGDDMAEMFEALDPHNKY